jgi:hypothetical protein
MSRRMNLVWHVARIGKTRNKHKCLIGKPESYKPLGVVTTK